MTVIVIYGFREHLVPIRAQLSDTIHDCMKSVLGMPKDQRAHRFVALDSESLYTPHGRSHRYTVIDIRMTSGRKPETKKALIKELFREIDRRLAIPPIDVEITITEQPPHCWGFRGMTGDEAPGLNYRVDV